MSKPPPEKPDKKPFPDGSRSERKQRLSLQPKSVTETPPGALRHTQSHRYDAQGKKKKKAVSTTQISSIIEAENSEDELEKSVEMRIGKETSSVVYENEKRGGSSRSTKSKTKEVGSKSAFVFDNAAFEGNLHTKRNSAANSSYRAPSVQSLEVVTEQYCCCAKRTKCERTLLTIVIVLAIIIIVLVVVIIFVSQRDNIKELGNSFNLKGLY